MNKKIILKTVHPQLPEIAYRRHMCLESSLAELFLYYKKDYAIPFGNFLTFAYRKGNGRLSTSLSEPKNLTAVLSEYGIRFIKKKIKSRQQYEKYLEEKLFAHEPTIVHFDCYYLTWDPLYGIDHNIHALLLVGMDRDNVYLSDPFFKKRGKVLKSIFAKASSFYYETEANEIKELKITHEEVFRQITEKAGKLKYFIKLKYFCREILHLCAEHESSETERKCMAEPTFLKKLSRIEVNKLRFYLFLWEWGKKDNSIKHAETFVPIMTKWQTLKMLLAKAWIRNYPKEMLNRASVCLAEIAEAEFDFLYNCPKKQSNETASKKHGSFDFLGYCNEQGWSSEKFSRTADLTGLGEYLCLELSEKTKDLALAAKARYNSIQCAGQEIELTFCRNPVSVKLLTVSEWGDYTAIFRVEYKNGEIHEISRYVFDWIIAGEERCALGSTYEANGNEARKLREYVYGDVIEIPLEPNRQAKSLRLPDCPNIHILSIEIK